MAIEKEALEDLLWLWANYRNNEFKEVSWSSISMSGKLIDFAKLGMSIPGTKHQSNDFYIPDYIDSVQKALIQLPLNQQHIIKVEYTEQGSQRIKARKLKIRLQNYRARLCRARLKLMALIV